MRQEARRGPGVKVCEKATVKVWGRRMWEVRKEADSEREGVGGRLWEDGRWGALGVLVFG